MSEQDDEFDQLLVRKSDDNIEFIFVKEHAVMYINYSGEVEADVIIENAAEKIVLLTEN